jgi:hypothetical protein
MQVSKKSSKLLPRRANIGCLFVCFVEVYAGYEEVEEETDEENGDQQQGQRLHPPAYTAHTALPAHNKSWMRSSLVWMRSSLVLMRSSIVVDEI